MPAKGAKCCCCIGGCVNIGSRFNACPICTESPVEWFVTSFGGAISHTAEQPVPADMFNCCMNVQPNEEPIHNVAGRLLTNSRFGGTCIWTGTDNACEDFIGTPTPHNHFEMELFSAAPGGVVLRLIWDDYKSAAWVNRDTWNCLCRNDMVRYPYLDEGDLTEITECGIPSSICLTPVPPCCPTREVPMPRRLYATITNTNDCECLDGVVIPLDWDPDDGDGKWVWPGTESIGSCYNPCIGRIRLWCVRLMGQSVTNWLYSIGPGPDTNGVSITGVCEPLSLTGQAGVDFLKTCCGSVNSTAIITFHE